MTLVIPAIRSIMRPTLINLNSITNPIIQITPTIRNEGHVGTHSPQGARMVSLYVNTRIMNHIPPIRLKLNISFRMFFTFKIFFDKLIKDCVRRVYKYFQRGKYLFNQLYF